jgi:hypothetical protein
MSYDNRSASVSGHIYRLFSYLDTPSYEEVAPKIKYWIEVALTQQLTTIDKLVECVSDIAWTGDRSPASFARLLKELRDSPRRSAQARSFVDDFCTRVFRWFVVASTESLDMSKGYNGNVTRGGGYGFVGVVSFIGHLVERCLLDRDLVRLHLIKPLTAHYYLNPGTSAETVRVNAICQLFVVAGSTLVQGVLEPEDVRVCFEMLGTQSSRSGGIKGLPAAKLEVQRAIHSGAPHRNPLTRGPGTSRAPCHLVAAE